MRGGKKHQHLILTALLAVGVILLNPQNSEAQTIKDVGADETVDDLIIASGETYDTMNVNDGGIANTTTINSGGTVTVNSGGTTNTTTVNEGGTLNVSGGTANNTTINNGGEMTVSGAGTAEGITANGAVTITADGATINNASLQGTDVDNPASITLNNSSTAAGVTLKNFGEMTVNSGNTANTTTVNEGGTLNVSGGTANDTTINNGGEINATTAGSTVSGVTVNDGGSFNFTTDISVSDFNGSDTTSIAGNVATGFNVTEGSTLTATNGGTITSSAVSGGTVIVESGGTITETAIGDNGTLIATESGATVGEGVNVVSDTGGKFNLSTNATVDGLTYNGQIITINNNTTNSVSIGEGSVLSVDANGVADNIVADTGGVLNVNNGGSLTNSSVENGGEMNVNGGDVKVFYVTGDVNASNSATLSDGTILTGGVLNLEDTAAVDGVNIETNGTVNVGQQGYAYNSTIAGTMNIQNNGTAVIADVNSGGELNVEANGNAYSIVVNDGGTLNAAATATLENLTANSGSVLNIENGAAIAGNLSLDASANTADSTFDFSSLLAADNDTLTFLSLTGGVNDVFNGNLVNLSDLDKTLNLSNGNYTISDTTADGMVQIGGWNTVNLTNGTFRLESDVDMNGTEQNFIINSNATLDVSGTLDNVLSVMLDGNVVNNGTIDFTSQTNASTQDEFHITGDYTGNDGEIIIDVNPTGNTADKLVVDGTVYGTTNVYLKSSSQGLPGGNILFAEAGSGNEDAFDIWRVEGSPYSWDTLFENNKWYGYVTDGDTPKIVPEVAAYYGLIDNMFMQTASLGTNLRNNIAENEFSKVPCNGPRNFKYANRVCRSSRPIFTGWAAPVYSAATVESPYKYDGDISGVDAGLDLIGDGYTKFGFLGSYRHGKYTYDENGDTYIITGEAETSIDSYLAGVYIRHDSSNWSIVGAVYAGILDADISTNDGVSADTSGLTYGATVDVNYIYQNINGFRIEPGVRISYVAVSIDEVEDNAGKTREFDDSSRSEIEAGVKFAKRWDFDDTKAEIFARPALVQTINSGSDFELLEERFVEATDDRTLVKLEAGLSFDMIDNWSAAIAGSYTFGDDYQNTTASLNLRYNF